MAGSAAEVTKLQQHLLLLKQEFSKLQSKYRDIEIKYNNVVASDTNNTEDTFASRLLKIISNLYNSEAYSDIKIKLKDKEINAHKIVLSARSNVWNENILNHTKELDWSEIDAEVANAIVLWLYTNKLNLLSTTVTLNLIKKAHEFQLHSLVSMCEQFLISAVDIRCCVKFYSVAEEIEAPSLREYCSEFISIHWDDLDSSDFEHMSGPLMYKMLKDKTTLPLHSAVRLQREDVVFLCLVDNSSNIGKVVNSRDVNDELPLELALRSRNESIATTLVQHNADVNILDSNGDTLLHKAIKKEDFFSAQFLLEQNCDATLSTRSGNDSALHLIAGAADIENSVKVAEKLINKSININSQNSHGFTSLHIAIQADNKPIFHLLLQQGKINVNIETNKGHTPLYYALLKYESGDDEDDSYAKELLKHGAETNPIYSSSYTNLLQILILEKAQKAAVFLCEKVSEHINHVNSKGETALHLACSANFDDLVRCLTKLGANPNLLTNEERQSPLHYAVKNNAEKSIFALNDYNNDLEKSKNSPDAQLICNFNQRDIEGETPISLALNEGFSHLIPTLIKGKADINIRNGKDFTLLHQAIIKQNSSMALFLLNHGADINAVTTDYETPLQLAIHCRLGEVVDALCTRGVDMSAPDRLGSCALWTALDSGQEDIASILVKHGADTDCWGDGPEGCRQTLLHRAIDENKESEAIFLIHAGCDLNTPRIPGPNGEGGDEAKDKRSPLHLCCQWGLEPVVRTLVEHRANVNIRDAENKTPLHIAIESQQEEIISLLLSVPEIDLSLRDKAGLSPFATALTFRNNKAAQAILDKFPSAAEQFDSKGQNFLHIALKKGDIESALFLLTVQVDVNSRVQDPMLTPPIHLAARHGNETLVRSLILAGARVDDRDAQRRTALHAAAEAGNHSAVLALIQNNSDCDATDVENDNAFHIAMREGHLNVVKVLLTESYIDVEAVNLKGRNPLHELCKYGKDNAATICGLLLECIPTYPINNPDILGNSPLLLAYINGNGSLCRVLVKANACLSSENSERVTIFNYQVPTKQLLNRLLDTLSEPAPWTNTDSCQECGKRFTLTVRTHHCRHCGRALCSKCSDTEVPIIKFGENKPVRVCKVCFDVLKTGAS
ncbi:rabankyrin-5 [Diabrotica virgifera virgifera]|uniref:Rabankyrin-5 n=1 Tax=Diabrotica virgifera virgifera TaxID=50390 RepID=A0ABM5K2K8_DIAVI|nr:rabankyrin-5 [Diabrotica virgifera virgifera]